MADYPDFIQSTGYGHVQGLSGANCKHTFGVYIEGVSPETYSAEQLEEYANAAVEYNGKTIPYDKATNMQRDMERKIREWKDRAAAKEGFGLDTTAEKKKIRYWQSRVKDFTAQTGLKRYYDRERPANPRKG